jgi:hypothetical protein
VATALVCCAGLLTESWSALVAANKGVDAIDFGSYLLELQLNPDDLEVSVPAVLKASDRAGQAKLRAALATAEASTATSSSAQEEPPAEIIQHSRKGFCTINGLSIPAPSKPLEASAGATASPDEAATKIQAAWRGWKDRRNAAERKLSEFEYLGMSENATISTDFTSCVHLEEGAVARRDRRLREYEQAKLEIEELLQVQETPLMVLEERSQVNTWLGEKIKNAGQRWPEVPLDGELLAGDQDGNTPGSENQNPKKGQSKDKKSAPSASAVAVSSAPGKARKAGADSGGVSPSTSTAATFASQLGGLIKNWKVEAEKYLTNNQNQHGVSGVGAEDVAVGADANEPIPALAGLPVPRRGSSIDAIDLKLLTTSTRPHIREKVRLTVREQARQVAAAANAARPSPPLAKQKQATAGAKPPSKVSTPAAKAPVEKPTTATKSGKPSTGNKEPKEPKREPLPPLRDLEEIVKDLAEQRIAAKCPEINFNNFIGTCCLVHGAGTGETQPAPVKKAKSGGKAAQAAAKTSEPLVLYPELSFAQIRQLLTVKCALPLAIHGFNNNQKLKTTKLAIGNSNSTCCPVTALIYGPQGSGKTMLVHAIAHESKASLFDLSPKILAGKYPGQQSIDIAVQSVFAAAKAAAPAIIYIDRIEQIFIRDEKRVAQITEEIGGECVSRIRRQLLAEIAALKPADGVLVLCTSSEPQACVSADEATFVSFFQFLVNIPLPDDRCRRDLLQNLVSQLKCSEIWTAQQLTLAAQLTQGYTAGALKSIMARSLTIFEASKEKNIDIIDCFIQSAAMEVKPEAAELQAVAEWTARAHSILGKTAAAGAK